VVKQQQVATAPTNIPVIEQVHQTKGRTTLTGIPTATDLEEIQIRPKITKTILLLEVADYKNQN
jgi:hypothetical protein